MPYAKSTPVKQRGQRQRISLSQSDSAGPSHYTLDPPSTMWNDFDKSDFQVAFAYPEPPTEFR